MVEKMVEKMGFLVEKVEEEGGEVIVVVVRMEEEIGENMVEELVAEVVCVGGIFGAAVGGLLLEKKEGRK